MRRRVIARTVICALALAMVGAACSRSESDSGGGSSSTTSGGGGTSASGSFAGLGKVCGPGDAKGATAKGVTDSEIRVGTVADPGFAGRPGLNQELFDAATVFTKW